MTRRAAESALPRLGRVFGEPRGGSDSPPSGGWFYPPGYQVLDLGSLTQQELADINRT
ncbi:hypothetical protein OG271_04065 [Micromonospora rifamycinica]|uniref:hypothetical protein n=1 Tax=Micromonospora rifamycinica TaxID=291594 RepID=UPI002E28C015|nr:hypothetical protein [Micromonospora rifamycinica]